MTESIENSKVILFLDFDGVLHPDPPTSQMPPFCKSPLLQKWLEAHPDVGVVISSTWRIGRSLEQLKGYFPELSHRIIGVTPEIPVDNFKRQIECEAWMRTHAPAWTHWVALDDRIWNFMPFEKRLILTDRKTGLKPYDMERLTSVVYNYVSRI